MTNITLIVTGAQVQAEVNGVLTSGMVGIPVTIRYDDAWNGLTKNLVCRCSRWNSGQGDSRTILDIGETATVAHEVMQAGNVLYLGIEGYNADGSLVIPTVWASCGFIHPGANTDGDPSADPTLPLWGQLQTSVEALKLTCLNLEQVNAAIKQYLEDNPIEIPDCSPHWLLETETITVSGEIDTVHFSALAMTGGFLRADGTVENLDNTYHTTVPYTDGMFISTGTNRGWDFTVYPPVVVLDGGEYSVPETVTADGTVTVAGTAVTPCSATLSGYSADAVVYVSALLGSLDPDTDSGKTGMREAGIYYYIPGGET